MAKKQITVKNVQAFTLLQAIDAMRNVAFPAPATYALLRNRQAILTQITPYLQWREETIEKHAQRDGEGRIVVDKGSASITDPKIVEEFQTQENNTITLELHEIQVTDFGTYPMSLEMLRPFSDILVGE
jgi:hypothetical protein